MGSSHGKIKFANQIPQTPTPAGCAGGFLGHNHNLKPYEQATDSVIKPKLRLKQFFKVGNDFRDVPSTPIVGVLDARPPKSNKKKKNRKKKSHSKLKRLFDDCENCTNAYQYDKNPGAASVVMEDIAPGTSVQPPKVEKSSKRNGKKVVREHFDQRVITKYDVKALIGKGSFSRVVRAEHRGSRHPYAIKLLPADNGTGPFENELAILNRVNHPHVIRLHEVFRTQSRLYMVMELATGGELYERIVAKGKFTEKETAETMKMVLDGLRYLHQLGVTHRDLKPENLLFSTDPNLDDSRILITDFGLANHQPTNDEELMTDTCGTPEYIAPEVLMRLPYSNKVDLWALGVIAYILLSGIMPFDSESRTRLYRQIIRGKYQFYPEFWCSVTAEAKAFVGSLLEPDPEERLSADQALHFPWLLKTLGHQYYSNPPPLTLNKSSSLIRYNQYYSPQKSHSRGRDDLSKIGTGPTDSPKSKKMTEVLRGLDGHDPAWMVYVDGRMQAEPNISYQMAAQKERTRSNRSIRSIARSDHTHKVDPIEVERLCRDPEIRRLVFDKTKSRTSSTASSNHHVTHQRVQLPRHVLTAAESRGYLEEGATRRKDYGVV